MVDRLKKDARSSLLFLESGRNNRAGGEAGVLIVEERFYYIEWSVDSEPRNFNF